MENPEKVFADGLLAKRKDNAPEYVIVNLSVKVDEFIAFLRNNEKNGWVNIGVKRGRSGNLYSELDTFQPKQRDGGDQPSQARNQPAPEPQQSPFDADDDDELPF